MSTLKKNTQKVPEYVHNEDQTAEQQEHDVMKWIEENFTTHPKRLVKLIQRLRGRVPTWIERSLCDTVLVVKDPVEWARLCIKEAAMYPVLMKKLRDEGNHGMVFWKNELYGFNLNTNPKWLNGKATERWTEEDENAILTEALATWMIKHRVRKFDNRIMLFTEFGFSGIPRKKPTEMDTESWALCKEQYRLEDAEKQRQADNEELKRLMTLTLKD